MNLNKMNKDMMHEPEQNEEEINFPGPLMSSEMQQEDLIRFLQWKAQTCFQNIAKHEDVESYFFWKIMELFCRQNGKVMMCEVATILFHGFSLFKRKASLHRKWKQWCIPLAQLLCSSAATDEHREAVIKMGDDLASESLTYAAHICYVVAKVELGSRRQFQLIGSDRLPFGLTVLGEAIHRTETYEYVLSLTSGLAQPNFQVFKLCHANRLAILKWAQLDFFNDALKYCETIARAILAFPDQIKASFIKRLFLTVSQLQDEEAEDPDWLLELHKLYRTKVEDANVNGDPEWHMASTSHGDVVSEFQDPERCMMTDEICALESPDLVRHTNSRVLFDSRYTLGELLGNGGFGSVFAGVRTEDGRQVAIKIVNKKTLNRTMVVPGETEVLPVEVALMKMLSKPPRCSNVVELLDWCDTDDEYTLVLERPSPCMDLWEYVELHEGCLSEAQARVIMLQVVQAAHHCCERGVLHRDIKSENLLINPDTLQIKLIDFGCGILLEDTPYNVIAGTEGFIPPEWLMAKEYMGIPATVWGLGILLFFLLHGDYPFESYKDLDSGHLNLCPMSQECLELLVWCLEIYHATRPTFDDLLKHEWFTEAVQSPDHQVKQHYAAGLHDDPLDPTGIVEDG